MNQLNFQDCRKAVNQAIFRPTAERKAAAIALLKAMMETVTNLEEIKPTKTKAKAKRKAAKRTPSQKVADAMDKAAMKTNEVGPIKPTSKGRKADVQAAKAAAQAVSRHTGAESRANRKAKAVREAVRKNEEYHSNPNTPRPSYATREVTSHDDRVASLEAKIEQLTNTLAVVMTSDVTPTANEVCFSDLPF